MEHWWRVLDRHEEYMDNLLEAQVKGSKISKNQRKQLIKKVPELAEMRRKTTKTLRLLEKRYSELENLEDYNVTENPLFVSFGFGHS